MEKNPKAMSCIKENLKFTKLEDRAVTMTLDVLAALRQMEGKREFDYIFMDPPYHQGLEQRALEYLSGSSLIHEDTVLIVEASRETDFAYLREIGFTLLKEKAYKSNKHVFLEKAGKEEIC